VHRRYRRSMARNPTADNVVAALAVHGPATKEEIAYAMGVSPASGIQAIRAAATAKPPLIRREQVDPVAKITTWVLTDEGKRRAEEIDADE